MDDVGWVPLNPGSAVIHGKHDGGQRFFGTDPGDFIAFQIDFGLTLPGEGGGTRTVPWLWFACWPEGRSVPDVRPGREDWSVRVVRTFAGANETRPAGVRAR